ncbi:SRPBCC domain-containing protein [Citricoccus sp. GCM10030269]|uniref:SRPBCC family protein n=1 Tax=Citricoccus sp. GCM10030269 TaxID=3273388 RepID=UPI003615A8A2
MVESTPSASAAEPEQPAAVPTATVDRSNDGCRVVVEVDVPAGVDDVWESVATGEGYLRWFVTAELEPREGGRLITHHGDFGDSEGIITQWEPGRHHYAYVEADWMGDGTPVPDWHTEITLAPASVPVPVSVPDAAEPRTRVRLSSGIDTEGEQWAEDIVGTVDGWTSALRTLAEYHAHFAGRQTAQALVMLSVPARHRLPGLLGLDGAAVGSRSSVHATAGGQPQRVTGTVIEIREGPDGGRQSPESVVLRVPDGEEAAPGIWEFGTVQYGDTRMSVVRAYLHLPKDAEPDVTEVARRTEQAWTAVLEDLEASSESR